MKNKINVKRIVFLVAFATGLYASNVYATDVDAMADLQSIFDGATIVENKILLDKNYDLGDDAVIINSGEYVIDLNGYNISSNEISTIEILGGNVTINDSGSSLGLISANQDNFAAPIYIENGSLTINNGKLGDSNSASDCGLYMANGTVIINNGELAGLIHGLYMEDGMLTINNGNIKSITETSSNDAIGIYGGSATINDGTFTSSTSYRDSLGLYAENWDNNTSIIINGGTFTGKLYGANFYKESNYEFSIKINGGIFIGNYIGLAVNHDMISNIEIIAGIFKAVSTNSSERLAAIAIEYKTTAPNINSIIKAGSGMYPSNTSLGRYTYETEEYLYLGTEDEVRIDLNKTISIPDSIHGAITADKETAIAGEEIALTITPESGYKLKQMAVLDKFGDMPVEVTNNRFTMPNYNVIISAEFEEDVKEVTTNVQNKANIIDEKDKTPKTGVSKYIGIEILVIAISVLVILISKRKECNK